MKFQLIFITFFSCIWTTQSYCQTKFGAYIAPSYTIIYVSYDDDYSMPDAEVSYGEKPGGAIGGFSEFSLFKSNFQIQTGLQFLYAPLSVSSYNSSSKWTEDYYAIEIPIVFQYVFLDVLKPYIGIKSSFNMGNNRYLHTYSLGFNFGVDAIFWKHILIGGYGSFDISSYMESVNIKYRRGIWGCKIGYIF